MLTTPAPAAAAATTPERERVRLSLAMIVKDEEATIARVLDCASAVCDELVVVDTGSSDATRDIARDHGAEVHELEWRHDFATARNASFAWCTGDWVLWLDADDVLPPATQRVLQGMKEWLSHEHDAVFAPYHYAIADDGSVTLSFNRERLIRRGAGLRWEGRIHEAIPVPGDRTILMPDLIVEHRPDPSRRARNAGRNIAILEREIDAGNRRPRTLFYYANELYDHRRFKDAIDTYREYLAADRYGPDRYWAQLYVAESCRAMGDEDGARQAALSAIGESPSRAEAYVTLGQLFYDHEEWNEAIPLLTAATASRRPPSGFVRNVDYSYRPWDYLSICLERLGRQSEALAAAQRALAGNPESDRVRANMRWMIDHL